jgi:soluble lytic murein transglycosylase
VRAWIIATLLSGVALGACAGAQACSSTTSSGHGAVALPPPGVQTPLALPSAQGGANWLPLESTSAPSSALDFSDFVPLLSLPELRPAAEACDGEDYAGCAALVAAHLQKNPIAAIDEPRWQLLLGSLYEKANDTANATIAFERASQGAWPLADYAALGVGRTRLALGEIDTAKHALSRIPTTSAAYAHARGLLAEAACQKGATRVCLEHAKAVDSDARKPRGWYTQGFRIVELLVNQLAVTLTHRAHIENQLATLELLRSLINQAPNAAERFDAIKLEQKLIAALPSPERTERGHLRPEQQLARAEAMANANRNDDANALVEALLAELGGGAKGPVACQARLLHGKVLSDLKRRSEAQAEFELIAQSCKSDVRTWALYHGGRAAFQDDRYADAERMMAKLEREAPRHRLADDARYYRAQSQREMGVEARFSELLDSMPEDYPDGDMTLDGLFALALRRMEKGDWSGAITVLRRGEQLVGPKDVARGQEGAGRERYFEARALIETGQVERGLEQYEAIISELPLSYYMLHAYSRLSLADPGRARIALERGLERAVTVPFPHRHRPEFDGPGFLRVLELLRQNDIDSARRELDFLDLIGPDAPPSMLWSVASLYSRAGSARYSHAVPRWQLVDWLQRWPVGPWRQAWEIAFPRPHMEMVSAEAKRQGVAEELVYAVMREESAFDPGAVSPANAFGLMQVISPTARRFGKEVGLPYDRRALVTPRVSIAIGTRVLSSYQSRFPSDPLLVIPSYNAGPGRPKRWAKDWPSVDFDVWVELIPYRETRRYTKRVLASRATYAYLYYPAIDDPLALPARLSAAATTE